MQNRYTNTKTYLKTILIVSPLLILTFLLSSCAPVEGVDPGDSQEKQNQQESTNSETTPETTSPTREEIRTTVTVRLPEKAPEAAGTPIPAVTGESPPELLEAIQVDLIERTGVSKEEIEILRDQSITWSDGSLGCPKPGEFYTQALVPGYWVVLKVGEVEYDYRASENGYFMLCEGGSLPVLPYPNE